MTEETKQGEPILVDPFDAKTMAVTLDLLATDLTREGYVVANHLIRKSAEMLDEQRAELSSLRAALQKAEEERDARRESLAQEIRDGLRKRGLWAPDRQSDLISAIFLAIDAAESRAQKAMEAVRKYKAQHIGECLAGVCAECMLPEEEHPTTATVYEGWDPSLPPHNFDPMDPCTCGLSEVLREGE